MAGKPFEELFSIDNRGYVPEPLRSSCAGALSHDLNSCRTLALSMEVDVGTGGVQRLTADLALHFPVRLSN